MLSSSMRSLLASSLAHRPFVPPLHCIYSRMIANGPKRAATPPTLKLGNLPSNKPHRSQDRTPKPKPEGTVIVDPHSFVSAVTTLSTGAKEVNVDKAEAMWGKLLGGRYGKSMKPDSHCVSAMMTMYNKGGQVDKGLQLWQQLRSGKFGPDVKPNSHTVCTALSLLSQSWLGTRVEDGNQLAADVIDGVFPGVTITPHVLTSLLAVYARAEKPEVEAAVMLWEKAAAGELTIPVGSTPINQASANVMVSILCRSKDVNATVEFWKRMVRGGYGPDVCVPTARSITSIIRLFAAQRCPMEWTDALLPWFQPRETRKSADVSPSARADNDFYGASTDAGSPARLVTPDTRVLSAALDACAVRRCPASAKVWIEALAPALGLHVVRNDTFILKSAKAAMGPEEALAFMKQLPKSLPPKTAGSTATSNVT